MAKTDPLSAQVEVASIFIQGILYGRWSGILAQPAFHSTLKECSL